MSAHVVLQIHLKEAIDVLDLPIGLQVKACCELEVGFQQLEKVRRKASS